MLVHKPWWGNAIATATAEATGKRTNWSGVAWRGAVDVDVDVVVTGNNILEAAARVASERNVRVLRRRQKNNN